MNIDTPTRILLEMLLLEQDVAIEGAVVVINVPDPQTGEHIRVYFDTNDDDLDWKYLEEGMFEEPVPDRLRPEINRLLRTNEEAYMMVQRALAHDVIVEPPPGPDPPQPLPQWMVEYGNALNRWYEAGSLHRLPANLRTYFRGYWGLADFGWGRDFIAILPTRIEDPETEQGYKRGAYVFRRESHINLPGDITWYGDPIAEGELWETYIPKLLTHNPEERRIGLLLLRENAIYTGLGRMLRRDKHLTNVTVNLPQFDTFDEFKEYVDAIAESKK